MCCGGFERFKGSRKVNLEMLQTCDEDVCEQILEEEKRVKIVEDIGTDEVDGRVFSVCSPRPASPRPTSPPPPPPPPPSPFLRESLSFVPGKILHIEETQEWVEKRQVMYI